MKPLAPNSLIQNRYLVVQLIGKGGMGDVYLAVDQRLGSAIALKRTFFSDDENLRNAFEREARMLARLRHPALTKVSDHFTEDNLQYLVMEHISGDDLAHRLEQNKKPFPLSWVLFWADQLLDALSYLHSHEPPIIHRDIKPQNLKLTNDNHIILLDFGLAKNSVGETRLSTTGGVIAYTPHYASMEQIRGTGTTARSDIYSLSATMYELLSNNVPPDALTRADCVLNGQPDPVNSLSDINPEVTPAIAGVIMKGLSLSSEQRFATAREMQVALREVYSQVQQEMSAQTVVFNADETGEKEGVPTAIQSNPQTEQISASVPSEPIGEKTEVMPLDIGLKTAVMPLDLDSNPNNQATAEVELPQPPVNLDATLPFVAPLVFDQTNQEPIGEKTEVMPFDIPTPVGEKTEIMPFDVSASIREQTELMPPEMPVLLSEKTEFIPAEIIDITQDNLVVDQSESFNPEATVPFVAYDGLVSEIPNQATTNFASVQPTDSNTESFTAEPEPILVETPPESNTEPKQKAAAGGKLFLVLGIILALGILGVAATGVGLYVMKPEIFGLAEPSPTAKPTAEPTAVPTGSPSPEPTLEANSNSNSNSSDLTNSNSGDTNTSETPVVADKTPRPGTADPTPTKPVVTPTRVIPQNTPIKTPTKPPPTKTPPTPKPTVCRTCPLQ